MLQLEDLAVRQYIIDYDEPIDVTLDRVAQRDGIDKWAIREKECCLNHDGEWESEPQPSSRDDAFLERCRFKTPYAALSVWNQYGKSRFEHYRSQ